jgi:uncharacterized protein (UPF0276 family)
MHTLISCAKAKTSAGLGLRRGLMNDLLAAPAGHFDFLEVAPENWIGIGGAHGAALRRLAERYPLSCHGLSLSLGGPSPLDIGFVQEVRGFLDHYNVPLYSEHLSYCSDDGHLYDLLPLPFTEEAVHHVAARIRQAQDILGRRLAVENVSYYAVPQQDMDEVTFTNAVLREADCELLLDVNNVYVNSINHGFDAHAFRRHRCRARGGHAHRWTLQSVGHFENRYPWRLSQTGGVVVAG